MNRKTTSVRHENLTPVNDHNRKNIERNIDDCNRRVGNHPDNCSIYYRRGISYKNIEEYDKAITDFTTAIEKAIKEAAEKSIELNELKNIPAYYFFRGMTYKEIGKYELAITDITEAIRLNDDKTANAHNNYHERGKIYLLLYSGTESSRLKHTYINKALEDFKKAMRLTPFHTAYYQKYNETLVLLALDLIWDTLQPHN